MVEWKNYYAEYEPAGFWLRLKIRLLMWYMKVFKKLTPSEYIQKKYGVNE